MKSHKKLEHKAQAPLFFAQATRARSTPFSTIKMARTKQVPTKMPAKIRAKETSKKKAAEPVAGGVKKTKTSRRFKPGTVAVRDIRKAQRHGNRGIPKSVIDGLVREIASNFTADNTELRFKKSSLRAIHEAAESFQTDLMRTAGTLSLHAKRKTLDVASMKLASTFMLCPHVFHATQGTAKAMRGCLGNKSKILWAAPAYPKDADDEKATKRAAEKALEKAAKKTAKAAESQQKADDVADVEEPTDSVIGTAEAGDTADVAMDGSDSDGE
jgi:histone H3